MVKTDRNSAEHFCHPPGAVCTGAFVVFKTKRANSLALLRFFDNFFDVIFDDPFLTLKKYCAFHKLSNLTYLE